MAGLLVVFITRHSICEASNGTSSAATNSLICSAENREPPVEIIPGGRIASVAFVHGHSGHSYSLLLG